jgi:hypothetical protein
MGQAAELARYVRSGVGILDIIGFNDCVVFYSLYGGLLFPSYFL